VLTVQEAIFNPRLGLHPQRDRPAEAYVNGEVHTTVRELLESLETRIKGTYVSVEPFNLFRYLDEQAFRFNERKDDDSGGSRIIKGIVAVAYLQGPHLLGVAANVLKKAPTKRPADVAPMIRWHDGPLNDGLRRVLAARKHDAKHQRPEATLKRRQRR